MSNTTGVVDKRTLSNEACNSICFYWIRSINSWLKYIPNDILYIIYTYYSVNARLETFELISVVGRGSLFGKLILVKDKKSKEFYVMKILTKQQIVDKNQVTHVTTERKVSELLSTTAPHPFCVNTLCIFTTYKKVYFISSFYPGGDLFYHLKTKRKFTEIEARFIVAQIVLAIGHLHKYGIIHRIVTPENIYFDENSYCILADYCLTKILKDNQKTHSFCGIPEYLAPEILRREGYSFSADWWCIGMLLHELVTGEPPFYSRDLNETYRNIQNQTLSLPETMSHNCKDIITKLLNRNPTQRLGTPQNKDEIGVENVKKHPFFKDINWNKLLERKLDPIYKAKIIYDSNEKRYKLNNFVDFKDEKVIDSSVPYPKIDESRFDNFDWINPKYV